MNKYFMIVRETKTSKTVTMWCLPLEVEPRMHCMFEKLIMQRKNEYFIREAESLPGFEGLKYQFTFKEIVYDTTDQLESIKKGFIPYSIKPGVNMLEQELLKKDEKIKELEEKLLKKDERIKELEAKQLPTPTTTA